MGEENKVRRILDELGEIEGRLEVLRKKIEELENRKEKLEKEYDKILEHRMEHWRKVKV